MVRRYHGELKKKKRPTDVSKRPDGHFSEALRGLPLLLLTPVELRTVLYYYKTQPVCGETTANLLVEYLSYTMRLNLSLLTLLLYALNAQPVTSAGRNQKL